MPQLRKLCLALSGVAFLIFFAGLIAGKPPLWQPAAVAATIALAIGIGAFEATRTLQFTCWVIATIVAALLFPYEVIHWGRVDLTHPWIKLVAIQTVMFGMGTQMGLKDFSGVIKSPWGVFVAVFSQFTVMPLVGFALIKIFTLPPEIAAGVILIGSCSSGLASNVMCYIARSNLALSITATAVTTMLAPVMTPTWMKLLAGTLVEVSFLNMMTEIIKIVLVPIGAGLLHDYLKHASARGKNIVHALATLCAVGVTAIAFNWASFTARFSTNQTLALELAGFVFGAVVFGVIYHHVARLVRRLDSWMPIASMVGILYFTSVATAIGRDNLLKIGGVLFLVAALHNALGYALGYNLARLARLDKNSARTVAIEVGLQNGGMAWGLASHMGKIATVGLAGTVFGAWMNISGSILANYWRRKPVGGDSSAPAASLPPPAEKTTAQSAR